jgi:replication-associated recombination protein RarA
MILRRPWIVETDPKKADFIIETERSRCAQNQPVVLIDEVKRFERTFAWVYARQPEN